MRKVQIYLFSILTNLVKKRHSCYMYDGCVDLPKALSEIWSTLRCLYPYALFETDVYYCAVLLNQDKVVVYKSALIVFPHGHNFI